MRLMPGLFLQLLFNLGRIRRDALAAAEAELNNAFAALLSR